MIRRVLLLALPLLLLSCGDRDSPGGGPSDELPRSWRVVVAAGAPEAVVWAAEDVAHYLGEMGLDATLETRRERGDCEPGIGRVVFLGDEIAHDRRLAEGETEQTFEIVETRCRGGGRVVDLWGGGLLGRQYAAYEMLHAIGVRFFHPEQEYVPSTPRWPAEALDRRHTPAFRWRSATLHLTHPLELGDAFRLCQEEHLAEARRYVDWQIKNLASGGQLGACDGELSDRGLRRGLLVERGLRFWGAQQGGGGTIDPDDPRSAEEQVAAAIDRTMSEEPRPDYFVTNHQVTEFTGMPDDEVVRLLTFVAGHFAAHYPDVTLLSQVHGTHTAPTSTYGVNYNALGQFAPENMGLQFHTLMFYDLFRPAPVYGNESFSWMLDLMRANYQRRKIFYFPESAWWLTFDLPVPLYLPITIEARDRDLQGLSSMLARGPGGGLEGHKVFGTGHEWGYWQNEYCSFRMAADLRYRWTDCVADVASTMGPAGPEVDSIVQQVVALQQRDLFDAEVLRWIVGTDDETEAAAAIGVVFHPLPPKPGEMLRWSAARVDAWIADTEPRLQAMEQEYGELATRLDGLAGSVAAGGEPWFREIRDGIAMNALRARHQRLAYGALIQFRRSRLLDDSALEADASTRLAAARETTQAAHAVVTRREADYRYRPIDRSIAGGPQGDADRNWTIYGYRYLNRAHHLFYWHRLDDLVDEAVRGAPIEDPLEIENAIVALGEPVLASVHVPGFTTGRISWGDGAVDTAVRGQQGHAFAAPGFFEITLEAESSGGAVAERRGVASVDQAFRTGLTGAVLEPAGASIIAPLIPGLVFGRAGAGQGALGFDVDGSGRASPDRWLPVTRIEDGSAFHGSPVDLTVPIANGGTVLTSVQIVAATLRLPTPEARPQLRGAMVLESVVKAIVAIGGFEENGARRLVADLLGFTPETLPASVPILVEWAPAG